MHPHMNGLSTLVKLNVWRSTIAIIVSAGIAVTMVALPSVAQTRTHMSGAAAGAAHKSVGNLSAIGTRRSGSIRRRTGVSSATQAKPVVIAGYDNGPVTVPQGSGLQTLTQMNLPAGNWAIFGKAWIVNTSSSYVQPECELFSSPAFDLDNPTLEPNGFNTAATLALNIVVTLTAPGMVAFECNPMGVSGLQVNWIKITAIEAGTLTDTNLG